jgi:hypothetical protein
MLADVSIRPPSWNCPRISLPRRASNRCAGARSLDDSDVTDRHRRKRWSHGSRPGVLRRHRPACSPKGGRRRTGFTKRSAVKCRLTNPVTGGGQVRSAEDKRHSGDAYEFVAQSRCSRSVLDRTRLSRALWPRTCFRSSDSMPRGAARKCLCNSLLRVNADARMVVGRVVDTTGMWWIPVIHSVQWPVAARPQSEMAS